MFQQLLISLFKFLAPFLRNAELSKPTHLLYKVIIELNDDTSLIIKMLPLLGNSTSAFGSLTRLSRVSM